MEEGDYSLQTLVDFIDDALQAIEKEKYNEASAALTEFIIVWPNVEMEVSTRNSSLYTKLESDLPILVSELAKADPDADSTAATIRIQNRNPIIAGRQQLYILGFSDDFIA